MKQTEVASAWSITPRDARSLLRISWHFAITESAVSTLLSNYQPLVSLALVRLPSKQLDYGLGRVSW